MKVVFKEDIPENSEERNGMSHVPYKEALWSLIWAATMTRLDLSFVAHNRAKFCGNPGYVHWEAMDEKPRHHLLLRCHNV